MSPLRPIDLCLDHLGDMVMGIRLSIILMVNSLGPPENRPARSRDPWDSEFQMTLCGEWVGSNAPSPRGTVDVDDEF